LRRATRRADSVDDYLDIVFSFWLLGTWIRPYQDRAELRELLSLLQERPPRTVVEIGTASGGTLYLLARVATPDALLVSIDLPGGEFGGGYARWRAPLYRSFGEEDQTIRLIRGDSHHPEILEELKQTLGARPVDFLFIDGDHTYEGVKQDFRTYSGLLSDDGLVALHDIVPGRARLDEFRALGRSEVQCVGEVPQFWQEVKRARRVREIVADWDRRAYGIGVVLPPS
jgi:predicted O-methyltransferase YrrM